MMFGGFLIPVLIGFLGVVTFAGLVLWAKRYVKVPPDQVAIVTGRKHKLPNGQVVGFRMVKGGATFVWPIREEIKYLPLSLITLDIKVSGAYNKDGVPVDIDAVANVKIKSEDQAIANAVERFLDKPNQITSTVTQTLEAHLRSIVGTMTIEELNSDRKAFGNKVTEESVGDLERMGIGVDNIGIKKIEDGLGYLASLGKRRTAEVKRDADVGKAEAEADAKKKSSDAEKDAETTKAKNDQEIELAKKELAVKKAVYQAEINEQDAKTLQAGLLAKATAERATKIAEQEALEAEAKAGVEVKKQEAERKQQELVGTLVKQAEAQKLAGIAKAEGEKQATILAADAEKQATVFDAEGKKQAALLEAQGIQAKLEAEAAGNKAKLLAEAEGIRAKLGAEAEGIQKKADAMKSLEASAQLLLLMEKSPEVIKALGEAGGDIAKGIFQSIAAPLGSIDNLTVYDSSNGDGSGALSRVANIVPSVLFEFLAKCKANGMNDLGDLVANAVKMLAASTQNSRREQGNAHDTAVGG